MADPLPAPPCVRFGWPITLPRSTYSWQHGGGRRPLAIASVTKILDTARRHTEYGYRQVHAALQWEHPDVQVAPITVYRVLNIPLLFQR